jgi:hypothetical protein
MQSGIAPESAILFRLIKFPQEFPGGGGGGAARGKNYL